MKTHVDRSGWQAEQTMPDRATLTTVKARNTPKLLLHLAMWDSPATALTMINRERAIELRMLLTHFIEGTTPDEA